MFNSTLLVGYFGKGNLGDEIILQQFLLENEDNDYFLFSYGLDYSNSNLKYVFNWKNNKLTNIITFLWALIFVKEVSWIGGTCFSDQDGVGGYNYMSLALKLKKKINYLYIGINDLKNPFLIEKSQLLLTRAKEVILRDDESLVNFKKIVGDRSSKSPMILQDLGEKYLSNYKLNPNGNSDKKIILIAWRGLDRYLVDEKEILSELVESVSRISGNFDRVVLFDTDDSVDFAVNNEMVNLFTKRGVTVEYNEGLPLDEKIAIIREAKFVLTARLHVAIAGSLFGVKTIAYNYSKKMEYQAKLHNYFLFDKFGELEKEIDV